jgi:hypothetical protein
MFRLESGKESRARSMSCEPKHSRRATRRRAARGRQRGQGQGIQPGETGVGARATLAGGLQDEGGTGKANEMRRQGPSEGDEGERKSRVQERDVDEGLYLCGGRGGAVRARGSDGAPYPIRKDAVSGCSDSEFYITVPTIQPSVQGLA